ncbi:hypothetical protein P168DRAFT_282840 [Aspergillus campestris IBT 28561]|uniref:Malonyl-CoA:ACP transacylase (MAT) domain-containing protein n=1 Tax=Aspergillus campestris (strain IBT 28561) TaxID=1392248 RepID=A0A2I1CZN1_ASPC2|nr:uncharacterized protein P168DRAFT_282840 [Aspergillus campestris IBT 28561]PKY03066.1 hypothetical protein P168DRAFT_282840 [Aspergillus campestris IBT 28561]
MVIIVKDYTLSRYPDNDVNIHPATSVNCFGIGGSNAHVLLDSAASYVNPAAQESPQSSPSVKLLVTSTNDQDALSRRIDSLTHFVTQNKPNEADLAYTLGKRREHLSHRAFALLDPKQPLSPASFTKSQDPVHDVCFVFTGQGAEWAGMGKGLNQSPLFHETIQELDGVLSSLEEPPAWSIKEELADGSRVNEAYLSQPLCTALQIVLVRLMRSWGVRPSSVLGHSSGEIVAAYAAGAITAKAAILLAYYRGVVATQLNTCGGMAAVGMGEPEARPYLQDGVEVACVNSPKSVTLSGDRDALGAVLESIRRCRPDVFCRRLPVNVAYHSYHMQEIGARYKQCIQPHVIPSSSMVPMYSSVDCQVIDDPQRLDSEYWWRNLRQPVQFCRALQDRFKEGTGRSVLVEIGPHSALSASIKQTIQEAPERGKDIDYIPTLVRGDDLFRCMLRAAGHLYIRSVPISLAAINGPGTVLSSLPSYPWQRDIKDVARKPDDTHLEVSKVSPLRASRE